MRKIKRKITISEMFDFGGFGGYNVESISMAFVLLGIILLFRDFLFGQLWQLKFVYIILIVAEFVIFIGTFTIFLSSRFVRMLFCALSFTNLALWSCTLFMLETYVQSVIFAIFAVICGFTAVGLIRGACEHYKYLKKKEAQQ